MIKKEKGITLVSLIITIVLMIIIASTVVYVSLDRFEINNLRKMFIDMELLEDKVSNYYLKYGALPILRNSSNKPIKYTQTLSFETNGSDNGTYYIIDINAMNGVALNYGKEGIENPNSSNDVYIINELSHMIYYAKGITLNDVTYYTLVKNQIISDVEDIISPSRPEINIISGTKNEEGIYTSEVEIEIIPGNDNWSQVKSTTYMINDVEKGNVTSTIKLTESGKYEIIAKTSDNRGNFSKTTLIIEIIIEQMS